MPVYPPNVIDSKLVPCVPGAFCALPVDKSATSVQLLPSHDSVIATLAVGVPPPMASPAVLSVPLPPK